MSNFKQKAAVMLGGILLSSMVFAGTAYGASYKVIKNDSLYKIGLMYNVSASTIKADNKLTGDMIYPGQVLYVRSDTYTVKNGDSLFIIANKYGTTVNNLRKMNNKWDDMIYPGQKLNVPYGGSGSAAQVKSAQSGSAIPYTQSELDLLARLVTSEAQSEPYNAQVGVAAVVVNRVKNKSFPNTITSVIYQKSDGYYQFTPVENGWINKPATQTAKKAALEALKGSDPSNGALYYFDDSATNRWLWSKPIKAYIGHMVFVY